MAKYTIAFWREAGIPPHLIVNAESQGPSEWTMDQAFKEVMTMGEIMFVVYATFTLYNRDFPYGTSSYRRGLSLKNGVYSYTEEGVPS